MEQNKKKIEDEKIKKLQEQKEREKMEILAKADEISK